MANACRSAAISDATNYTWRKTFGGNARQQLLELNAVKNAQQQLKMIVADLERDKLTLKERPYLYNLRIDLKWPECSP